jgi:hypothetical protein
MPAFIPSYEAALFFIDLVTAILLFDQFARLGSIAILVLAAGYLFDALIIVPHALSFPDASAPIGLLGAREDLWLAVVMWIWLFDIGLSAVIGSKRFAHRGWHVAVGIGQPTPCCYFGSFCSP